MSKKKIGVKQKGLIGLAIMAVLSAGVIFGSDPIYKIIDDFVVKSQSVKSEDLKDGTYTVEKELDESKETMTISVTNGAVTEVVWDVIDKEGNKKSQLSMEGKYVMTENGLKWHEQANAMADYFIQNQSVTQLALNEEGKTDAVAGVSITVSSFVDLAKECLIKASGLNTSLKDGIYQSEAVYEGSTDTVTIEIANGSIIALTWDVIDKDGNKKSQLSMDGKYVMTEQGAKWHEQAQALSAFVLEEQSLNNLTTNAEGKTDAIAGVSINIQGFTSVVEDCLKQASS